MGSVKSFFSVFFFSVIKLSVAVVSVPDGRGHQSELSEWSLWGEAPGGGECRPCQFPLAWEVEKRKVTNSKGGESVRGQLMTSVCIVTVSVFSFNSKYSTQPQDIYHRYNWFCAAIFPDQVWKINSKRSEMCLRNLIHNVWICFVQSEVIHKKTKTNNATVGLSKLSNFLPLNL